jgi:hypothetical protein
MATVSLSNTFHVKLLVLVLLDIKPSGRYDTADRSTSNILTYSSRQESTAKQESQMFGNTATTAWELEAERRVELAQRAKLAREAKAARPARERGLLASLLKWAGALRQAPSAGLKDART